MQVASNLLRLPDVRQTTDYSCGPTALQAVLGYYGEEHFEQDLIQLCQADAQEGTPPERLAAAAKALGFEAEIRQNLTLDDLESLLEQKVPVMVAAQAWRNEDQQATSWSSIWDSGHWMVVVGSDKKNIYLEDPSILGSLGQIPKDEFLSRWHDIDADRPFIQGGVIVTGKNPSPPPLCIPVE